MNLMTLFSGEHGDFATMFADNDFQNFVIRYFHDAGGENEFPYYKAVIGFTSLDNGDIMLHLVDAEGVDTFDDLERSANRTGVDFRLLSDIMKEGGFSIYPGDQLEDDDCLDCKDCMDFVGCRLTGEDPDDTPVIEVGINENDDLCLVDEDDEILFEITPLGRRFLRAEEDDYDMYDGDEDAAREDDFDLYEHDDDCKESGDCSCEACTREVENCTFAFAVDDEPETTGSKEMDARIARAQADHYARYFGNEDHADEDDYEEYATEISDERKEELSEVAKMLSENPLALVFLNALTNFDYLTEGMIAGVMKGEE